MNAPRLSVLICTFDRAFWLQEALDSLVKQDLPADQFEVVVVDDGSTDNTRETVAGFESRLCIRYVYQENQGLAGARNHAAQVAAAPIVLFMDDDDIADQQLLNEHLRSHADFPQENVAVLGFTDLGREAASSPLMYFVTEVGCYLYSYPKIKHGQVLDYTYFWGGRTSCKRSLLLSSGLFDPVFRFGCEDIELGYRLSKRGLKVVYNKNARCTTIHAASLEQFCRRSEQQGYSNWIFSQKHPVAEVELWADVSRLGERWAYFEPRLPSFMKSRLWLGYHRTRAQ